MIFDAPDPPKLWVPPKPAIVRAAPEEMQKLSYGPQGMMGLLGGKSPSADYLGYSYSTGTSFSSQPLGLARPKAIVVFVHNGSSLVSSVTVAGTPATRITFRSDNSSLSVWVAYGVSATSGTVSVGGDPTWVSIQLWAVYDLRNSSHTDAATSGSFSVTGLDVAAKGIVLAGVLGLAPSGSRSYTFPAGFTEGRDGNIHTNNYGSTAARSYLTAQTNMTLSVTENTTNSTVKIMVAASFR